MDKFEIVSKEYCCGCGLCSVLCPKKAIVMTPDDEGFLYPDIDFLRCIHCNICKINCIIQKRV